MNPVKAKSLQKAYKRYHKVYDFVFGNVFHPGRTTAVEHLHCKPGDRILEAGVGTGLSLPLYPSDVKVVGIDLSKEMLRHAEIKVERENIAHVESLHCMDALKMDFPDNSFDKVVAMYLASVVPDPKQLVDEIRRVCKPGGMIIFLNHFQNRNPVIQKFEAMIQPLATYLGFHPDFPLEEFLDTTGFEVNTAIPVNVFDYWTLLIGYND